MASMSKKSAEDFWRRYYVRNKIPLWDKVRLSESWSNYVDALRARKAITAKQATTWVHPRICG